MFLKTFAISLAILISGCAQPKSVKTSDKNSSNFESKSGYFYALIEKYGSKYIVVSIEDEPYEKLTKPNQEIIKLSNDYKDIDLYFTNPLKVTQNNTYECKTGANINKYNQCTSDFSTSTLGTSTRHIDYALLNKTIKEMKLIKTVEQYRFIGEHMVAFNTLKTTQDCDDFIKKYNSIPQEVSLVQKAMELKSKLEKRAKPKKVQEMANGGKEVVLEKDNLAFAKTQNAANKDLNKLNTLRANIASFQKNIKVGTKTNCGEVLELQDKKAKIARGSSFHWIEAQKLYPANHECMFARGKYIPPPSF